MVDESGRYYAGSGLPDLVPPEPSEQDRNASVDLSKQPIEKLFRLLYFELFKLDKSGSERTLHLGEYKSTIQDAPCANRLLALSEESKRLADEVNQLHLNTTGTSGLYWTLHKYPDEHSWAWLLSHTQDRVMRKVWQYLVRLQSAAVPDDPPCLSANLRTVLMTAVSTWKKILGEHSALLWNSVAFGVLGDVTSWRDMDEEGQVLDEPGGEPPNVSWSENLIFGNMFVSSLHKFLDYHSKELNGAVYQELMHAKHAEEHGTYYDFTAGQEHRQSSDGSYSAFEYLRRQTFNGWVLDKGLMRGFLRHCLKPVYGIAARRTVGDFGAGGGQYSAWLNDTGLVAALAFDNTMAVRDITGGAVQEVDLMQPDLDLQRKFDWVMCLDVASLLPKPKAALLLRNIKRHVLPGGGLLLNWGEASDQAHQKDTQLFVEKETGFSFDQQITEKIRLGAETSKFRNNVMLFLA
eukprot:Skav229573  [mRNA]  locus=scaffold568:717721:719109:+ [translate_table: standard]